MGAKKCLVKGCDSKTGKCSSEENVAVQFFL